MAIAGAALWGIVQQGAYLREQNRWLTLREPSGDCVYDNDLTHLPSLLARGDYDVINEVGGPRPVGALRHLPRPGGRFLFYVYRRKGPVREFTDDYVRGRLAELDPEAAWSAILPLTKLGRALGELDIAVDVPEDVELLGIPAGRIDIQRLFYWNVVKAYYDPELSLDEMAHINFDWFAPRNAHRQSSAEVRAWCAEAGLEIERERIEEAGITVVARKAA